MSWAGELRQAFARLRAGEQPRVSFSRSGGTIGEIGSEFNSLAADMERMRAQSGGREDIHRSRNRLAGMLAALQVLGEVGELPEEDEASIREVIEEAKKLDAQLR